MGCIDRLPCPLTFHSIGKQWQENRLGEKRDIGIFMPLAPCLSGQGLAVAVFCLQPQVLPGGPLLSGGHGPLGFR